jgi:uncharacterized damage-inducible protein DinB
MLSQTILLTMFEYNHHINNRLLDLARKVTPEQWIEPIEQGQRNLHETLFHYLSTEEEWLSVCAHGEAIWRTRLIENFPDVDSLQNLSDQTYAAYLPYIDSLTDSTLNSTVCAMMPHGIEREEIVWHMLLHMLYHSAQHRSEVAILLTRFNLSPGFIDFYGFHL